MCAWHSDDVTGSWSNLRDCLRLIQGILLFILFIFFGPPWLHPIALHNATHTVIPVAPPEHAHSQACVSCHAYRKRGVQLEQWSDMQPHEWLQPGVVLQRNTDGTLCDFVTQSRLTDAVNLRNDLSWLIKCVCWCFCLDEMCSRHISAAFLTNKWIQKERNKQKITWYIQAETGEAREARRGRSGMSQCPPPEAWAEQGAKSSKTTSVLCSLLSKRPLSVSEVVFGPSLAIFTWDCWASLHCLLLFFPLLLRVRWINWYHTSILCRYFHACTGRM